jgi:hypothetical protein
MTPRRHSPLLAVLLLASLLAVAGATSPRSAAAADVGTAATDRYFGKGAWDAVRSSVASTSRTCSISDDGLTALVLAPVFKESSAATTPSSAPAPMTLSRYDEWNGTYGTTTPSSNYGLYAFRDPNTPYQRAFWSPGIGVWQYDSAGLGAPLTTTEAMDVGVVAADAAALMARNYCGAASGSTDQQRRYAAWRDWGYPCTLCQEFFAEMTSTSPKFANLHLVDGIDRLGGVVQHTCSLPDVTGTVPCWYVDPSVGVIQGSTAWATFQPDGGTSNTQPPTPLPYPFYVVDRGTTEVRYWLEEDTGYGRDIRASRTIGRNARPSSQSGSGLTWTSGPALCDLTTAHGACDAHPPPGVKEAALSVSGSSYRPIALDADAEGHGDVLWYAPGTGKDSLWLGHGDGTFTNASWNVNVSSTFDDVVVGDVDGNGADDVIWYQRASGLTYLWRSTKGSFTSTRLYPGAGRRPFALDQDGNGDDEIFWYGEGSAADALWNWNGSAFTSSPRTIGGTETPLVGDFDHNGRQDILWYGPGSAGDVLWLHAGNGGTVVKALSILGVYEPLVADLDGDGADDVVWYRSGTDSDRLWFGGPGGAFTSTALSVSGDYQPIAVDILGMGRDQVIWYAPGSPNDFLHQWSTSRVLTTTGLELAGHQQPVVGKFSAGGADGIVWYGPGTMPDSTWYR